MSGLILAGIGKGIADAGSAVGGMMFRSIEQDRNDSRLAQREELADKRMREREALVDQRKIDAEIRAEERKREEQRRDAEDYAAASTAAPDIGYQRRFEQFKKDIGPDSVSTEEEMRSVFDKYYNQRKVGPDENAERYAEPYSKEKADVIAELRRRGASGGVINQAIAEQKSAVEAERAATRLQLDRQREDRRDKAEERRYQEGVSRDATANRRIDAMVNRPNREPADRGTSQERLTTMINSANATLRDLANAPRARTPEEAAERKVQYDNAVRLRNQAMQLLEENLTGRSSGGSGAVDPKAEKPGNPGSTLPAPKSKADLDKLPSGTRYTAPDGTERIKR